MGVINLTPDSFSNSNKFSDYESFSNAFEKMLVWADVIDLGAESTAPFNKPVSEEEELKRFKKLFFPYLEQNKDPAITLSIDTYKISVFESVALEVNKHWPKTKIIFNDVSGKIDDELLAFFKKTNLDFSYVFSHNNCPSRSQTNEHMNYVCKKNEMELLREMSEFFVDGINKLRETKIPFYVDPCFGFSKTREQNQYLLKKFSTFMLQIPPDIGCVYGISRKSFLRFPVDMDPNDSENQIVLDQVQAYYMAKVMKNFPNKEVLFRIHNESVFKAASIINEIYS